MESAVVSSSWGISCACPSTERKDIGMRESKGCLALDSSPTAQRVRLQASLACVAVLRSYRTLVAKVDSEVAKDPSCHPPAEAFTERAREAELAMRVLVRHGLEALNEARDTGTLEQTIRGWAGDSKDGDELGIRDVLRSAGKSIEGIDQEFWDEALGGMDEADLHAFAKRGRIRFSAKGFDGRKHEILMDFAPRTGSMARVSVSEFFGVDRGISQYATAVPVYSPET